MQAYDRFFVGNGYLESVQGWAGGAHYRATEKGQKNPAITNKLSNTLMVRTAGHFEREFIKKAQQEQFGVFPRSKRSPKDMECISMMEIILTPGTMTGNSIPTM